MTRSTQIFIISVDRKRGKTKPSHKKEERVKVAEGNLARIIGFSNPAYATLASFAARCPATLSGHDNDRRKLKRFRL